ncbi:CPBP family intramembrane glutamic endopeptidase [Natrononativus amylolyticus]|uniref:CPBP family intramembrane glutamic endopeptidase n=1 Tax=Natrononativus amylolyticus TaxID=2963434 RepID=UPI0020CF85C9|nr:CPBP family intramembrane glutamic endopeptidase [Natrononativus amylolyticus]
MTTRLIDGTEPAPDELTRASRLLGFTVLALGLSWIWWIGVDRWAGGLSMVTMSIGAFGPPVAAVLVATAAGDRDELRDRLLRWRVDARWYALVFLGPPLLIVATVGGYVAIGGRVDTSYLMPLWTYPVLLVMTSLIGGGQEELGWRGYALPHLQARVGPLAASVGIGLLWAVWHYPLFALGFARIGSGLFSVYVVFAVATSVLFTWAYNGSGGSVPLLVAFHGGFNAANSYVPFPADLSTAWLLRGEAVLIAVLCAAALIAIVLVGPSLGRDHAAGGPSDDATRSSVATDD